MFTCLPKIDASRLQKVPTKVMLTHLLYPGDLSVRQCNLLEFRLRKRERQPRRSVSYR